MLESEPPHRLLPAVLGAVLATLPQRFAPSRGFATACLELATSLTGAWQAGQVQAPTARGAEWSFDPNDVELQNRLASIVGWDCSVAWWVDVAEMWQLEGPGIAQVQVHHPSDTPTAQPSSGIGAGSGPMAEARAALAAFLLEGAGAGGARGSGAAAARPQTTQVQGQAWAAAGAMWVVCALEDILGAVAAHTARKTALPPDSRPRTPGGSRPPTAGASSSSSARPMTPTSANLRPLSAGGRPGSSSGRPTSSGGRPSSRGGHGPTPRQLALCERRRLLSLKHFIAAVKGDDGLRACPLLETCLAEVAMGTVPHLPSAQLMAHAAFRERILQWAEQETAGGGPEALEQAVSQALKTVVASLSTSRPVSASSAATNPSRQATGTGAGTGAGGGSAGRPGSSGGRASWLPQSFVQEFNAEGDEVEPEPDTGEVEARGEVARTGQEQGQGQGHGQGRGALAAAGRAGKRSQGAASRARVKVVAELS